MNQLLGPWTMEISSNLAIIDRPAMVGDIDGEIVAFCDDPARAQAICALPLMLDFIQSIARRDPIFAKGVDKRMIDEARELVSLVEARA